MENLTKALYIVGGVLIAVMVLVGVTYVISSMSTIQNENMLLEKSEQAAKFNAEYEVFNKKLMHGTDLISVLNKASSNNEKYVDPKGNMNSYLNGDRYEKDYLINIEFKLKTTADLTGAIRNYQKSGNDYVEIYNTANPDNKLGYTVNEVFMQPSNLVITDAYEVSGSEDINFDERKSIKLKSTVCPAADTKISMYTFNTTYEVHPFVELIREETKKLSVTVNATSIDSSVTSDIWSFSTFDKATAAFKKKKFVCREVGYCTDEGSSAYGRINYMYFEEK